MKTFEESEFAEQDPILSEHREDENLQRNILGIMAKKFIKMFQLPEEKFDDIANAVTVFWTDGGFSKNFRKICCAKPDKLKRKLHHKLYRKTNIERADLILNQLGFRNVDDFVSKNLEKIKKALLEAGIDVNVGEEIRKLVA